MRKGIYKTLVAGALALVLPSIPAHAQSVDALINKLLQKGVLTEKEADDLRKEQTGDTNLVSASKWKINEAIKSISLFGDARFRYEYRGAGNAAASGIGGNSFQRERFRYALRAGIRGELYDNFYYGLRLETSTNPRSTWVTFGGDTGKKGPSASPSDKSDDGINIGQAYVGWRPTEWLDVTVGRMPQPLYTTPMLWDFDINPEGAAERVKFSIGPVDLFATFGQFVYDDRDKDTIVPSGDTFVLAWQVGANIKLSKDISLKVAPVVYTYNGIGSKAGLNMAYTGEGTNGLNPDTAPFYNQNGINDLLVLETPLELNFKVGKYAARAFGDFAYNFEGNRRARAAFAANDGNTLSQAYTGEDKAYLAGLAFGNLGLVYGQTSKKNTWEARAYWQHVEQYAADVNLLDSDFFEGRGNLQGVFTAFAYSISDAIIATARYGYAQRINNNLGTGGGNPDLPELNPIRNYHIVQLDLTWRF